MTIKYIIFDNNGVLTTSLHETVSSACAKHLGVSKSTIERAILRRSVMLDSGRCTDVKVSAVILKDLGLDGDPVAFSRVRNAAFVNKPNVQRFTIALSKKYKLALLSNFGDGHDVANKRWKLERIIPKSRQFVSSKIGMVKPHKNIFRYALRALNVRAREVIFIDDNSQNIAVAKSLGIDAIRFATLPKLRTALSLRGIR